MASADIPTAAQLRILREIEQHGGTVDGYAGQPGLNSAVLRNLTVKGFTDRVPGGYARTTLNAKGRAALEAHRQNG